MHFERPEEFVEVVNGFWGKSSLFFFERNNHGIYKIDNKIKSLSKGDAVSIYHLTFLLLEKLNDNNLILTQLV